MSLKQEFAIKHRKNIVECHLSERRIVLLMFVFLVFFGKFTPPNFSYCYKVEPCDPGWELFQDKCYYFNAPRSNSFHRFKNTCLSYGAKWAHISNKAENDFIRQTLNSFKMDPSTLHLYNSITYIGLTDKHQEGDFKWWDDHSRPTFTDWYPGKVNHRGEDCVGLSSHFNFHWNDEDCSLGGIGLCEKPAKTTTKRLNCPAGWRLFEYSCYLFYRGQRKNWWGLKWHCLSFGSNLVHINTPGEQKFVEQNLRAFNEKNDGWWIGLNDLTSEGNFIWDDDSSKPRYTDWKPGEPNNQDDREDCVSLDRVYNYKWNDDDCLKEKICICEKPAELIEGCETGWRYFQHSCYLFNTTPGYSYQFFKDVCARHGAHLVHINNPDEANFIRNTLDSFQYDPASSSIYEHVVYIGLTDRQTEGVFRWEDDQTRAVFTDWYLNKQDNYYNDDCVGMKERFQFRWNNWYPNKPDNYYNEDCVGMKGYFQFRWNDEQCYPHDESRGLCEKPATMVPKPTCQPGWGEFQNSCYSFYAGQAVNYSTAEDHCQALGSHLIHVNTYKEGMFLKNTVQSINIPQAHWWIGLSDQGHEGTFLWTDDYSRPTFTDWNPGEPNNMNGNENCVSMDYYKAYRWNDDKCTYLKYFICEMS